MKKYPHQPLTQVDYNPVYAILYQEEKGKIAEKLGGHYIRIEHIGSTAVPGLSGKPIIDILVIVNSEDDAKRCLLQLEDLGYEYMGRPDQHYLRKSTSGTTGFHVHMTTLDNPFWRERVAFRNYLIDHADVKEEYAKLKQNLVQQFGSDKNAYREGKGNFMAGITEKAIKEYKDL